MLNRWEDVIKELRTDSWKEECERNTIMKANSKIEYTYVRENMKIYTVRFKGTNHDYNYLSKLDLIIGATYDIVADGTQKYNNPVTIVSCCNANSALRYEYRIITSATIVTGTKRPNDKIKKVVFNREKMTTAVLWEDGVKTIIKCQEGDNWDEEKALALCYMKRVLGNRGAFNETLKKYCTALDATN